HVELAFGADIPQADALGDGDGEPAEDQRRDEVAEILQAETRAEGGAEHLAAEKKRVVAGEADDDSADEKGEDDRGSGGGERHRMLEPGEALQAPRHQATSAARRRDCPPMSRPTVSRSASATGKSPTMRPS